MLKETGLDLGYISRNILPTGKVLVSLNEAGVPQYDIVENVAWDAIECSPATMKLVGDADAVCWGLFGTAKRKVTCCNLEAHRCRAGCLFEGLRY